MRFQQNRSILERQSPLAPVRRNWFSALCAALVWANTPCVHPALGGDKKLKPPRRAGGKHLDWHTRVLPGIAIVQTIRIPG